MSADWQPIDAADHLLRKRWRVILYCPSRVGRKVVEGYHGFNGQFTAWFCSETRMPVVPILWMPFPDAPE